MENNQKIWFITGANRGLGAEIAKAALVAGHKIAAAARQLESVREALGESDNILAVQVDVTSETEIKEAVTAAIERFGRIDVLVNNAGYGLLGAFEELSSASIERQFATNVFGAFAVTRAVLPIMRLQHSGHIMTISSISGIVGYAMSSIYSSTKFAITGWSEALSLELKRFGIHATVVHPGRFRTDFLDQSSAAYADLSIDDYKEAAESARKSLDAANHLQQGDPVAFGRAIVELATVKEPPVRFAAGSDAVQVMNEKAISLQETTAEWQNLSLSMDID